MSMETGKGWLHGFSYDFVGVFLDHHPSDIQHMTDVG